MQASISGVRWQVGIWFAMLRARSNLRWSSAWPRCGRGDQDKLLQNVEDGFEVGKHLGVEQYRTGAGRKGGDH